MQDTMERWGGELRNLVGVRGLDYGLAERIETQLVMKTGELARLLGPKIVADAAIIGTDTFFFEGAAFGILLQARSGAALRADILRQRLERKLAGGVEEHSVEIGGKQVAYLASLDGRVRSYYVVDGDYHFVTTSKALVERFLATAGGAGSLGRSAEFRHARTLMPLARDDTVWVFLSDAFFRNLTGPRYRTEMIRRLRAAADIKIVELAVLGAAREGKPAETIDDLIAAAMLPPDFGPRPDGSRAVLADGEVYDSRRGRRGSFVPVPDVPVDAMSQAEVSEYRRFAEFYAAEWGAMDPTILAVQRRETPGGRQRVVLDLQLSPFAAKHFEVLSRWAGPPRAERVVELDGDAARVELAMPGQYVFGGLRDVRPPLEPAARGALPLGRLADLVVGYVGTTGEPGILSFLASPLALPPGTSGDAPIRIAPAAQKSGEFTVFSLNPEVLAEVAPKLKFLPAERPAQLRARVDDVSQARITPWINEWSYRRSRRSSLGNLRLLHALDQQFHVPPEDARQAAEFLLDARLVCPLGGKYVYRPASSGGWTSTAIEPAETRPPLIGTAAPAGYVAPLLRWFRGLELEATMTRQTLTAHGEVVMESGEPKQP